MALHDQKTTADTKALETVPKGPDKRNSTIAGRKKDLSEALEMTGAGAEVGKGDNWTTVVKWGAVHADSEDGTGVEATVLGPDHKLGSEPDSANGYVCPLKHQLEDFVNASDDDADDGTSKKRARNGGGKKSKKDTHTYIKGHLLNEHLGGPGNDSRNLAAIPAATNKAMSGKIEEPIKALVNVQLAWIYYKVVVSHANHADAGWYANRIDANWHELMPDEHDKKKAVPVPGTAASCTLDIPSPAVYKKKGSTAMKYSEPSGGGTKGATFAPKTDRPTEQEKADDRTARSKPAWNSIVLRDKKYVENMRDAFLIAEPIVEQLKAEKLHDGAEAVGTDIANAIVSPHSKEEADALTALQIEIRDLYADDKRSPAKLTELRRAYEKARAAGVTANLKELEIRLNKLLKPGESAAHLGKIANALLVNDPIRTYAAQIDELSRRLDKTEGALAGLTARSVSPTTVDRAMPGPGAIADKREAMATTVERPGAPKAARDQVLDLKPTQSANKAYLKLVELKAGGRLPAPVLELSRIDANIGQVVALYDGGQLTPANLETFLVGAEKTNADKFVEYTKALLGLAAP